MNIFLNSPLLTIATVIFFVCVIIGFFGDKYLRSQNKIDSILKNKNSSSKNDEVRDNTDDANKSLSSVNESDEKQSLPEKDLAVVQNSVNDYNNGSINNVISQDINIKNDNLFGVQSELNNLDQDDVGNKIQDYLNQEVSTELNNNVTDVNKTFSENGSEITGENSLVNSQLNDNLNTPQIDKNQIPFDGQVIHDENINNMF